MSHEDEQTGTVNTFKTDLVSPFVHKSDLQAVRRLNTNTNTTRQIPQRDRTDTVCFVCQFTKARSALDFTCQFTQSLESDVTHTH